MKGYLVTPCANFIAPFEGKLAVGVNTRRADSVRGDMSFDVSVRPATELEWNAGAAEQCAPKDEPPEAAANTALNPENAAERLRQMGDQLAVAILGKLHPSGNTPVLRSVEARATPTGVSVDIASDWKGGFLGTDNTTVVRWEFNERRHIAVVVPSDTANIIASADARKALDRYFETKLYPEILK